VAVTADTAYPPAVIDEFKRLAQECYPCYQCGTCTSSCPSGRELYRGPRRLVRLILAGDIDAVMKGDDLWRCTECGTCTSVCRMEIDVAGILGRLRRLEREHGTAIRCPERSAADVAGARLRKRPRIDNMQFGVAMMAKGHFPKDKVGAAETGMKIAKQMLPRGRKRPAGAAGPAAGVVKLPFYAGCALPQDHELHALVHDVAAGFGVVLDEAQDAGCCGHPSRGAVPSLYAAEETVQTACPACDASLEETGIASVPLWNTLTDLARRSGAGLTAASPNFVPYVGCLADRDASLAALAAAAELSGATMEMAYPTLHNGCCGALGGMYRGATKASAMLLEFAAERGAPVVTPCVLCRDNLRSAARELKLDVPVRFWPEFFRATATAPEVHPHD
jgi:Fe-S oxidoreductase